MQVNSAPLGAAPPLDTPGFGEYFGILKKRRRLLLMVAGPIVLLGAVLAIALPDVYRSSGLIEIEGADKLAGQNLRSVVARESDEPMYADQYVRSLSTLVLSDKSLSRLLAAENLYDGQKDDPGAALEKLRGDIDVDIVTMPILDPESGREREVVTAFTVAYDNAAPARAKRGADWLVNAFLEQNRLDRRRYAAKAAAFFGSEAERMRKHIAQLEAKVADFKSQHAGALPDTVETNRTVMERTENDIRNNELQMQALRRERVFLTAQLQQAQSAGPETANLNQLEEEYKRKSAVYDESHPDMIALRRQIDTLRAGGSITGMSLQQQLQQQRSILAEARQRYSDEHPDVKRIKRHIEGLEARIAAGETADTSIAATSPLAMQVQTQLNANETQIAALQQRSTELRAKLADLEGRMVAAPAVEQQYQVVTRDLDSARAKYQELLNRQMDAEVSEAAIAGGTADKFRVKSSPKVPEEPAQPQRIAIFAVSFVLGSILGITAVVMAQLFDQTVRGLRDVREILDVTPLSSVPVIRRSRTAHARRKLGLAFAARTAIAVLGAALAYYATIYFIA